MPFRSKAQQRRFFADPRLQKYAKEYAKGTDFKHLPERVHQSKGGLHKLARKMSHAY